MWIVVILPEQSSCSFWLQQPLQQELWGPWALFSLLKQSASNRDLHCFKDSFSRSLRFFNLSSSSDILEAEIPTEGPAGRGMCPSQPQSGCEFLSSKKEQFCLMGCLCQCLPWQRSWSWNPGMLQGKYFSASQPWGPAPSFSSWKNMPLSCHINAVTESSHWHPKWQHNTCMHTHALPQNHSAESWRDECSSQHLPFPKGVPRMLISICRGLQGRHSGQMCRRNMGWNKNKQVYWGLLGAINVLMCPVEGLAGVGGEELPYLCFPK